MDGFGGDWLFGLKNRKNKVIGEEWNLGWGFELGVVVGYGLWVWILFWFYGCFICYVCS